jgi:hypothetical protein
MKSVTVKSGKGVAQTDLFVPRNRKRRTALEREVLVLFQCRRSCVSYSNCFPHLDRKCIIHRTCGAVAQWLVQETHNLLVLGSNPSGPNFIRRHFAFDSSSSKLVSNSSTSRRTN